MSGYSPGDDLDGKYEVLEPLGSGGMGAVYLVRHLHLQELRVVKVLRQDVATDPAHQKRFLREARLATQIKHPNVAILYDFAQLPEGAFYMVWEHVEGREVGEHLRHQGPFSLDLALNLGIQGLRGLGAIHATGVIHRDISPDNLMLASDVRSQPQLKIIDLGLAKTLTPDPNFEITQAGTFMGKLRYCSPEQAEPGSGESLDRRSDLYSFGLVLYEMICGRPPFDGGDSPAFVFRRVSEDPLPLAGRNPDVEVPETVSRVVLKALARDRDQRYDNAIEFIEALDATARELAELATQRIQLPTTEALKQPAPPASRGTRRPTTAELSPQERRRLLAQIDRAAERAKETTQVIARVDLALDAGRVGEAERLVAELEEHNPTARNLSALKARVAAAVERQGRDQRLHELEEMIARYLRDKQVRLAELALEQLVEMAPQHPRRGDFSSWVEILRQEVAQDHRVEELLAAGREALAAGDLRVARKRRDALRKADPSGEAAAAFEAEIEAAGDARRQDADVEDHRGRFDAAIEAGDAATAESELAELERLGASRVTVQLLETRLAETRARGAAAARAAAFEERFESSLAADDFEAARDAALELGRALPGSSRPAEMFAEAVRHEERQRRRQAVEQGQKQVEALLAAGEAAQARMALKILLQIDPTNGQRERYERRLQTLEGRAG